MLMRTRVTTRSSWPRIGHHRSCLLVPCTAQVLRGREEQSPRIAPGAGVDSAAVRYRRSAREWSADARRELRAREANPVLDKIGAYLAELVRTTLPKSSLRKAVNYARNQWEALRRYTEDGHLTIDNNVSERTLDTRLSVERTGSSWEAKRRAPEPPCCTRFLQVPSDIASSPGRTYATFCSACTRTMFASKKCCPTTGRSPPRGDSQPPVGRISCQRPTAPVSGGQIAGLTPNSRLPSA